MKDDKFKSEPFLREVKEIYTDLINRHIADPEQQLKVFDKNSVYLPTKKIGKNNPKAAEIEADNAARQEWNRTADMALLSGIEETKILEIKKEEIHQRQVSPLKKRAGCLPCSAALSAGQRSFCKALSEKRICRPSLRWIWIWRNFDA